MASSPVNPYFIGLSDNSFTTLLEAGTVFEAEEQALLNTSIPAPVPYEYLIFTGLLVIFIYTRYSKAIRRNG